MASELNMNGTNGESAHMPPTVIGSPSSFWLYSPSTGFDLTHPSTPTSPPINPRLTLSTTTSPITLDPAKTALIIIDMQNFFLSPAFGRNSKGAGHKAMDQLIKHAIPAARKAGVRVVWVNWGLTEEEVEHMPASMLRTFGAVGDEGGKDGSVYVGLGGDCGKRVDGKGGSVDAGGLLMRGAWNSGLYGELDDVYEEGRKLDSKPDVWIHKNRMSGLWGGRTELEEFLEGEGLKTLLFTGVNTDQCVGGTLQDAFSKGYDCVLLGDGAGTSSPAFAQDCMEYNAQKNWGFMASCEGFAKGVDEMASKI
jgi:nicotinamidase-related amidase